MVPVPHPISSMLEKNQPKKEAMSHETGVWTKHQMVWKEQSLKRIPNSETTWTVRARPCLKTRQTDKWKQEEEGIREGKKEGDQRGGGRSTLWYHIQIHRLRADTVSLGWVCSSGLDIAKHVGGKPWIWFPEMQKMCPLPLLWGRVRVKTISIV